jgi:hypothetical protein
VELTAASAAFVGIAAIVCVSACASNAELPSRRPSERDPDSAQTAAEVTASPSASEATAASASPGTVAASAPALPEGPRIWSTGYTSWIRQKPEVKEGAFLGYVRAGNSIRLKSKDKVRGVGCPGGFFLVEPRGYVCHDRTITDDPPATFRQAADATRGGPGPLPYRYGLSNGTPMYNRIPTAQEQERYEKFLGKPGTFTQLIKVLRSHEELAVSEVIPPRDEVPAFLKNGGSARTWPYDLVEQTIPLGSMVSFTKSFEAEGRTWLLAADHTLVPADRVRPFRPTKFRGLDLSKGEAKLPIAWMRVSAKPKYLHQGGAMTKTEASWPVRTHVELTGAVVEVDGKRWHETRDRSGSDPYFVAESDATVVEAETKVPIGVKEGQKWFFIRLTQGTLVAYEGTKPAFATLVSPGKGGVPVKGRDPVEDATTPLGTYSVTFKDRAATMSPETGKNRTFWISDVPHTLYFDPPFALHGAFWHERFGEYVSAGCVNLSPVDAEHLFGWSDPPVPAEWQGATGAGASENGPTSIVVIRR